MTKADNISDGINKFNFDRFGSLMLSNYLEKSTEVINLLRGKYSDDELEGRLDRYINKLGAISNNNNHIEYDDEDRYLAFYLHGESVFLAIENSDYPLIAELISTSFILSAIAFTNFNECYEQIVRKVLSVNAKKGAAAMLLKNPKQKALKAIKADFHQSTYPFHKRGYKAKFAKEMLEKYPVIADIKSINRLVAELSEDRASAS